MMMWYCLFKGHVLTSGLMSLSLNSSSVSQILLGSLVVGSTCGLHRPLSYRCAHIWLDDIFTGVIAAHVSIRALF